MPQDTKTQLNVRIPRKLAQDVRREADDAGLKVERYVQKILERREELKGLIA